MALNHDLIIKTMTVTNHRKYVDNPVQRDPYDAVKIKLIKVYQYVVVPIQESLGDGLKVVVNSGYRCPGLNKAVGGAANSFHMYTTAPSGGRETKESMRWAVDLDLRSSVTGLMVSPKSIFLTAKYMLEKDKKRFDLVYFEGGKNGWIHIQGYTNHELNRGMIKSD